MFSFSSEILCCVSGYQTKSIKHQFNLSLNYWKLNFILANKGLLLLKLKHVEMWFLNIPKKYSFHNFSSSSSSMYILLNKYFCYNILKKTLKTFILMGCRTFLCVYDMRIVLLKWNNETLIKWLSEQFWRCCSCVYVLIETTHALQCVCVC